MGASSPEPPPSQQYPMAETKTKPTGEGVDAYLAARATAGQLADCKAIMTVRTGARGAPDNVGHSGEACRVGYAIRGREIVVYVSAESPAQAELLTKLGKHKMGKVCLYIKNLADIDAVVLEAPIAGSVAELAQRYDGVDLPCLADRNAARSSCHCCSLRN
jgi:hypothetical protein